MTFVHSLTGPGNWALVKGFLGSVHEDRWRAGGATSGRDGAGSEELSQRERQTFYTAQAHRVALGLGLVTVVREGYLRRDACPTSVLRCDVFQSRALQSSTEPSSAAR